MNAIGTVMSAGRITSYNVCYTKLLRARALAGIAIDGLELGQRHAQPALGEADDAVDAVGVDQAVVAVGPGHAPLGGAEHLAGLAEVAFDVV